MTRTPPRRGRPLRLPRGVIVGGVVAAAVFGSGYLDLTPGDARPVVVDDVLAEAAQAAAAQAALLTADPEPAEAARADRTRNPGPLAQRLQAAAREQKAAIARKDETETAKAAKAEAARAQAAREKAARAKAEAAAERTAAAERARLARTARVTATPGPAVVRPVAVYSLTGRFGQSGLNWAKTHTGLDFACPLYSPVRAVAAGTVVAAGWAGPYGWRTIVRHADGLETWYAHQSAFVVRSGQVRAGDLIGLVGDTGNATGPHLHLEVRYNGAAVDPAVWFGLLGLPV